jgi:hypothetical protein
MATNASGWRAMRAVSEPAPTDSLRYSGSAWTYSAPPPMLAIAAGLVDESGSNSVMAPPVASERALIPPVGYPKPCVLSVPCAPAAAARTSVATPARSEVNLREVMAARSRGAARR